MDELRWVNGFESARAHFDDVLRRMRAAGDRLLLGSVAEQIVRHASVPVLLVRSTPPPA